MENDVEARFCHHCGSHLETGIGGTFSEIDESEQTMPSFRTKISGRTTTDSEPVASYKTTVPDTVQIPQKNKPSSPSRRNLKIAGGILVLFACCGITGIIGIIGYLTASQI
jgi:hypothetical protein